jgi:hypothetical protein
MKIKLALNIAIVDAENNSLLTILKVPLYVPAAYPELKALRVVEEACNPILPTIK